MRADESGQQVGTYWKSNDVGKFQWLRFPADPKAVISEVHGVQLFANPADRMASLRKCKYLLTACGQQICQLLTTSTERDGFHDCNSLWCLNKPRSRRCIGFGRRAGKTLDCAGPFHRGEPPAPRQALYDIGLKLELSDRKGTNRRIRGLGYETKSEGRYKMMNRAGDSDCNATRPNPHRSSPAHFPMWDILVGDGREQVQRSG